MSFHLVFYMIIQMHYCIEVPSPFCQYRLFWQWIPRSVSEHYCPMSGGIRFGMPIYNQGSAQASQVPAQVSWGPAQASQRLARAYGRPALDQARASFSEAWTSLWEAWASLCGASGGRTCIRMDKQIDVQDPPVFHSTSSRPVSSGAAAEEGG